MNADHTPPEPLARQTLEAAATVFRYHKDLAERAVEQLHDEQMHQPLDANTNSVAVVMKHVAGNLLSRWTEFLSTDGEKPWRDRDAEFIDTFRSRAEVLEHWERGWGCLFDSLNELQPDDLARTVTIRGEPHPVPLALARSLAHCAYHVGQIVQTARILAGKHWQTLTIPRGQSAGYNRSVWSQTQYVTRDSGTEDGTGGSDRTGRSERTSP